MGDVGTPGARPSAPEWQAFEAEALPHLDRLFRLAMWLERDRTAAEDLVQDTMIQALRSYHRYTPGTNCRAWLVSILQHLRSNRRRAAFRHREVEDVDDHIAETVAFVPAIPQTLTDDDILTALRTPEPARTIGRAVELARLWIPPNTSASAPRVR